MEILKYGKKLKNTQWIKKCKCCGSVLVYDSLDIEMDMEANEFIECPVCKDIIYIGIFRKKYNEEKHGKILPVDRKIGFGN